MRHRAEYEYFICIICTDIIHLICKSWLFLLHSVLLHITEYHLLWLSSLHICLRSIPVNAKPMHELFGKDNDTSPHLLYRLCMFLSPRWVSPKEPSRIKYTKTCDPFLNLCGTTPTKPLNAFIKLPPSLPNCLWQSSSFFPEFPYVGYIRAPSRIILLFLAVVKQAMAIGQIMLQSLQRRWGNNQNRTRNIVVMLILLILYFVRERFCLRGV